MVEFFICKTRIRINFLFTAMLSLLSLWDRSGCLFLSVVFSLLHELGHITATALCRGEIEEISFLPFGIAMKLKHDTLFSFWQELFVLFAGCGVNALLGFFLRSWELCLYINVSIFIFNLLPVANLDGGRILRLVFTRTVGEERANRCCNVLSFLFLLPISAAAFYIAISSGQFSLLICSIYLSVITLTKREKLV